jgi:hypothetical protein
MGRFLQGLADAGLDQRLARIQVPGRIVQAQTVGRLLLDQQKAPLAFDDGGHGDMGFPAVCHAELSLGTGVLAAVSAGSQGTMRPAGTPRKLM